MAYAKKTYDFDLSLKPSEWTEADKSFGWEGKELGAHFVYVNNLKHTMLLLAFTTREIAGSMTHMQILSSGAPSFEIWDLLHREGRYYQPRIRKAVFEKVYGMVKDGTLPAVEFVDGVPTLNLKFSVVA